MSGFLVSVLIVTHNSAATIGTCLVGVTRALGDRTAEILVFDNASSDATLTEIERAGTAGLRITAHPENLGFARAVNLLAIQSSGDYLLLLNPDCTLTPSSLDLLLVALDNDPEVGAVGPIVRSRRGPELAGGGWQPSLLRIAAEVPALPSWLPGAARSGIYARRPDAGKHDVYPVDWVAGTCLLMSRESWDRVGGLSERWFMYCEDMDLGRRLAQVGRRTVLVGRASVEHVGGASHGENGPALGLQAANLIDYFALTAAHGSVSVLAFRTALWTYFAARWLLRPSDRRSLRPQMRGCWSTLNGVESPRPQA